MAVVQNQMQRLEQRNNQELSIVLRGVNQNTWKLEELNQCPPHHLVHSTGTDESWIPSTFHSVANNQHDQIAPGYSNRVNRNTWQLEELNQCPPHHLVHSTGTDESWIPSTFHSVANNQHDQIAPGYSNRVWDGENQSI
jgi:hypothetical protein